MRKSQDFFICQQGYPVPNWNPHLYSALMLQPKIVTCWFAIGVALQSPWLFFAMSAVLWWSTLVPTRSVFNVIYNYLVAYPENYQPLTEVPEPRRFAQGLAATVALVIAVAHMLEATATTWAFEGLFAVALLPLLALRFCPGANLYHVIQRVLLARPQPSC